MYRMMPSESKFFQLNYSGVSINLENIKVLTQNNHLYVKKSMQFDRKQKDLSSMDHFAVSILSSILKTIVEQSQKQDFGIEEIEGTLEILLANPLTLLDVIGYTDEPEISALKFKIYLYADKDEDTVIRFCRQALKKCPLYNTMKQAVSIQVVFQLLL